MLNDLMTAFALMLIIEGLLPMLAARLLQRDENGGPRDDGNPLLERLTDSYRDLLEAVKGVAVTSTTTVENAMLMHRRHPRGDLARQIHGDFMTLGSRTRLTAAVIVGGEERGRHAEDARAHLAPGCEAGIVSHLGDLDATTGVVFGELLQGLSQLLLARALDLGKQAAAIGDLIEPEHNRDEERRKGDPEVGHRNGFGFVVHRCLYQPVVLVAISPSGPP